MKNKTFIAEGSPIKNEKDITKFIKYMVKKYHISQEKGVSSMLVGEYKKSPKGKDHIVMNNVNDEWFVSFISNDDVISKMEIDKNTKVYS